MTLSLDRLHRNGNATLETGYGHARDILDDPEGYPPAFIADLQRAWDVHPWQSQYRIGTRAADVAAMARDGLIEAAPSGWTFGYPHAYVGDGYLMCPACVLAQAKLLDDDSARIEPEQCAVQLFVSQGDQPESGDTCDQCDEYIPGFEPHCGECGDTEGDVTTYADGSTYTVELISNDAGDLRICRRCLYEALQRTRDRNRNQPVLWRGSYGHGQVDDHASSRLYGDLTGINTYRTYYIQKDGPHAGHTYNETEWNSYRADRRRYQGGAN